jgi:hypothetical protein
MLALPTLPPLTRLPTELPSSPSDPRPACCLWLHQPTTFRPCKAGRQLNLTCHMTTSVRPHTHHSLSSVRCVERGLTSATPSCLLVGMDMVLTCYTPLFFPYITFHIRSYAQSSPLNLEGVCRRRYVYT